MDRTLIRVIGAWIKKNKGPLILTNMVKDGVEVETHMRHSLNGKHNIQLAYKKALLFRMQKLNRF